MGRRIVGGRDHRDILCPSEFVKILLDKPKRLGYYRVMEAIK